jgi:hypothetical protein
MSVGKSMKYGLIVGLVLVCFNFSTAQDVVVRGGFFLDSYAWATKQDFTCPPPIQAI